MATMVDRLLDLADELIDANPRSSAIKRRAVSTAYYAAFHALMRACAGALINDAVRNSREFERVYRALDHGSLKKAFQVRSGPLAEIDPLKRIGDLIVPLQSARIRADYEPPRIGFYEANQAREFVVGSRKIVALLNGLSAGDTVTLAVHLIFKDRPS